MDAIFRFAEHVAGTKFDAFPDAAVTAAKRFIADALGVGVSGSAGLWTQELIDCAAGWGEGGQSRLFVRGTRLPASTAALVNAYQTHNAEFDCLHEQAVVHALTAVLPASLAVADRVGGVSGRHLIEAVVLGVDVACGIGLGAPAPMPFFRPGVAGGFGAAAAAGKLLGFDAAAVAKALAITYSKSCGSMQAHEEGTMLLALQIGFNARNAVQACDLARLPFATPKEVLEGRFGYYALFERDRDLAPVLDGLGKRWCITELAQKPFPTGRATHGTIEALGDLRVRHGFTADQVERVVVTVNPIMHQLVGRPMTAGMPANYARLCLEYCIARTLRSGTVTVDDFAPAVLADSETLALGARIAVVCDENRGGNGFSPSDVEVFLRTGERLRGSVPIVGGHPEKPLPEEAHLEKFWRNWVAGVRPLPRANGEALLRAVSTLEEVRDVRAVVDLTMA